MIHVTEWSHHARGGSIPYWASPLNHPHVTATTAHVIFPAIRSLVNRSKRLIWRAMLSHTAGSPHHSMAHYRHKPRAQFIQPRLVSSGRPQRNWPEGCCTQMDNIYFATWCIFCCPIYLPPIHRYRCQLTTIRLQQCVRFLGCRTACKTG